jgi:hypothetical protein
VAAEAKHVRPLAQPQPYQGRVAAEFLAGADELGDMGRQFQVFKLNLTDAVVEGDA